jgi:Uma2 family endonuclease
MVAIPKGFMPMSDLSIPKLPPPDPMYPSSDGKPIADNTLQFDWIAKIKHGMDRVFRDDPNVFVAADLFWYPVEGNPKIRTAPDTLVAFGRPKGDRGSYIQFMEDGIPPQVVFEVLSPGNRPKEMTEKFRFYEKYGIEEYYIYDPDNIKLTGYQRRDGKLKAIPEMNGWVSPRLGVRFDLSGTELKLFGPDGRRFLTVQERDDERNAERQRADRLAAQLRALGIEPSA